MALYIRYILVIATIMFFAFSLGYYYQGYRIYSKMFTQTVNIVTETNTKGKWQMDRDMVIIIIGIVFALFFALAPILMGIK